METVGVLHASTGLGMKKVEEQSVRGDGKPQRWKKNGVKHRSFEGKEEDRWNCPFCDHIGEAETKRKRQMDKRAHIKNRHPGVMERLRVTLHMHRRSWPSKLMEHKKVIKYPGLNRYRGVSNVLRILTGNREPLPLREPGAITDTGMVPSWICPWCRKETPEPDDRCPVRGRSWKLDFTRKAHLERECTEGGLGKTLAEARREATIKDLPGSFGHSARQRGCTDNSAGHGRSPKQQELIEKAREGRDAETQRNARAKS